MTLGSVISHQVMLWSWNERRELADVINGREEHSGVTALAKGYGHCLRALRCGVHATCGNSPH